jgi:hypothetical protein
MQLLDTPLAFTVLKAVWRGRKVLALAIVSFFQCSTAFAQIDNSAYKVEMAPQDLGVCGANSFEVVRVTAKKNTLNGFEIAFHLPPGVSYIASTAGIIGGTAGYSLTEIDVSNLNQPVFAIENGSTWGVGDKVNFKFERTADCAAVQFKNGGGIFKDAVFIEYADAGMPATAQDTNNSVYAYNLLAASLSIQNIAPATTSVGATVTRPVQLTQGGQGCISDFTYYIFRQNGIGSYVFSFGGTPLTPYQTHAGVNGDTLFYHINLTTAPFLGTVGDGDNCFENGESIAFLESFRVLSCNNTQVRHHAYWGCSSDLCQSAAPQSGGISFGSAVPAITLTETVPATIDLCDTITYTVRVANGSGAGVLTAYNLNVIFGMGHNSSPIATPLNQVLWGETYQNTRHWGDFKLNGYPIPETVMTYGTNPASWGRPSTVPSNLFTSDPDGPGGLADVDGDGYFDDLPPGASTTVTFKFWTTPRSNCGTGQFDYLTWEHHYFDVSFYDQCGSIRPDPKRIDFDYKNFIRDYQTPTSSSVPTDVDGASDFIVSLKPYLSSNSVQCHGQDALTGAYARWDVRIFLPTGVSLAPSDVLDAWATSGYGATKTVVPGVGGDTVIYALNKYAYNDYTFKLRINCAAYTAAGGGSTLNIPYRTNYYCRDGSGVCWKTPVHCGNFTMTAHCLGGCKGPSTISFDAVRTTPGYTNYSMSTLVALTPATPGLDHYNAADTMVITTRAVIVDSMIANLGFDLQYTANAAAGGVGIIQFVSGQITIKDISAGTFSGPMSAGPVVSSAGNNHTQRLDLSNYTTLVSPTYKYGEGNQRDTVVLKLKYVWSKNFNAQSNFELMNFRGTHFAVSASPFKRVACDTFGDRAYYHKMLPSVSSESLTTTACSGELARPHITRGSAIADVHPSEYRPPIFWDSTLVVIPHGSTFGGTVNIYDLPDGYRYNITSFTIHGDSVWIYPPPGFRNNDQMTTYYPRVEVQIYGDCEAAPTEAWNAKFFYTDYAYHPNPAVHEAKVLTTSPVQFAYTHPSFLLQSPTPTQNGFSTSVNWDVELCNTSTTAIGYNWFRIKERPGLNLDSVVNTASATLMPIITQGGFDYVKIGALVTASSCNYYKVFASYNTCNNDTLILEHGWDCVGYPADFATKSNACYARNLRLIVEPQEAEIQLGITNSPSAPLSLCTQFPISLDYISAQISDAIQPTLSFELPGGASALAIDSITIEHPQGSGNIQSVPYTVAGSTVTVQLNAHSVIAANGGLLGTQNAATAAQRIASITLYLKLNCTFPSGSDFDFTPHATSPCGDPAQGSGNVTTSNTLFVSGATAPYDAFTAINLKPAFNYCGQDTVNFITTIVNGTTGTADTARIILPPGLNFVTGSLVCHGPHCPIGSPTVINVGGHQELLVGYPSGVPSGDAINFTITVDHSAANCANPAQITLDSYISAAGLSCGPTSCSASPIGTGSSTENFILAKPNLLVNAATATVGTMPNGDGYYTLDMTVGNNGAALQSSYAFGIYCSDGSGNPVGGPLYTGSLPLLGTGASTTFNLAFISATNCSQPLLIRIAAMPVHCLCSAVNAHVPLTILASLPDTDGDEVPDIIDLDDDNDGIPDAVECPDLLSHGDFEHLTGLTNGNNIGVSILPWVLGTGQQANIVQVDGAGGYNYGQGGPYEDADPATGSGTQQRYLDIVSGSSDIYQSFTLASSTTVTYSGAFSTRENTSGQGSISIRNGNGTSGTLVDGTGLQTINAYGDSEHSPWQHFDRTVILAAGTYSYVVAMTDYVNFDEARVRKACPDTDGDGVPDLIDLDSDNDGIFDLVEAGHGKVDANDDGRIDGAPSAFGANGLFNGIETAAESGILNYVVKDSDGDGTIDARELDSDNDGCHDDIEAGFTDTDGDGTPGPLPITVDGNGVVTSGGP